jgi:phenylacetate-CoA ligase
MGEGPYQCYAPTEQLSPAERSNHQAGWLRALVAHAYANAPAVRRKLDAAGVDPRDIQSLVDLTRIPITRKDDLIELQEVAPPFGGLLGVPLDRLRRAFQSPGPILDPQGLKPDYWRFATALHAAGLRSGDIVICSFSYHLTPAGFMFDDALGALGCTVLPAGVGNTELQIGWLRSLNATGYVGTPSFLNILLEKADELGWRPGAGLALRSAAVAAEMLPESLRSAVQARGVSVCQSYGTADLGLLAYECSQQCGLHIPESAIVELIDPATGQPVEPGQPGEVVATVDCPTYPLLRFGTGDLSAFDLSLCPCGRTSPRLTRIIGRIGDAVKVRGMFVHPRQVDEILTRFPEIPRCQLVVTRTEHRDELTIRLETAEAAAELIERVVARLRDIFKVRAEPVVVPPGTIAADAKRILDERSWE